MLLSAGSWRRVTMQLWKFWIGAPLAVRIHSDFHVPLEDERSSIALGTGACPFGEGGEAPLVTPSRAVITGAYSRIRRPFRRAPRSGLCRRPTEPIQLVQECGTDLDP